MQHLGVKYIKLQHSGNGWMCVCVCVLETFTVSIEKCGVKCLKMCNVKVK